MAENRNPMTQSGWCVYPSTLSHKICYAEWVSKGKPCSCSCHKEDDD